MGNDRALLNFQNCITILKLPRPVWLWQLGLGKRQWDICDLSSFHKQLAIESGWARGSSVAKSCEKASNMWESCSSERMITGREVCDLHSSSQQSLLTVLRGSNNNSFKDERKHTVVPHLLWKQSNGLMIS